MVRRVAGWSPEEGFGLSLLGTVFVVVSGDRSGVTAVAICAGFHSRVRNGAGRSTRREATGTVKIRALQARSEVAGDGRRG